jgi:hypothetical protein
MNKSLKICSGGQTGVDRAALDVALDLNIPCGGWCPKGRIAEDGPIPETYPLREATSENPDERTALNVKYSTGTLIIHNSKVDEGTAYTITCCMLEGKPMAEVDLSEFYKIDHFNMWIEKHGIEILNVAGPRESYSPGIYSNARRFLERLLSSEI